jgi:glycosyltransferase involved in cell wall biosynthesis
MGTTDLQWGWGVRVTHPPTVGAGIPRPPSLRPVQDSSFVIATNGTVDGPAQALRDYLLSMEPRLLTCVHHPLLPDEPAHHTVTTYENGVLQRDRTISLVSRPPATYPLDLLAPLRYPAAHAWFGFNALAVARGLAERRRGRCDRVVYWCVDFTPDRFGRSPLTAIFDAVDRWCCCRVDARFELSQAGRDARDERHSSRTGYRPAPSRVVPMGAWLQRVPRVPADGFSRRRIVYMGHLAPGKGVSMFLAALGILARRGSSFTADVIGRGPLEGELRQQAAALNIADCVTFHGFVKDHQDVERLLATGSIAAAPYEDDPSSFTRFADPGKLRAYLAAGLPIVMTNVPPNAEELAREAGATVASAATPEAFADALERSSAREDDWLRNRAAALRHAEGFDWPVILGPALESLGFGPSLSDARPDTS